MNEKRTTSYREPIKLVIGSMIFCLMGLVELIGGLHGRPIVRWGAVWSTPDTRVLFACLAFGVAMWWLVIAAKKTRAIRKKADAEPKPDGDRLKPSP